MAPHYLAGALATIYRLNKPEIDKDTAPDLQGAVSFFSAGLSKKRSFRCPTIFLLLYLGSVPNVRELPQNQGHPMGW